MRKIFENICDWGKWVVRIGLDFGLAVLRRYFPMVRALCEILGRGSYLIPSALAITDWI
jgi:hypothetical protein